MTRRKSVKALLIAVITAIIFAVSAMASTEITEIKGGFGEILGLDSTKTYQILSRTLKSDGSGLTDLTDANWTDYDPTDTTVSLAGIYGVREKETQEFLCNVYVYGAQSDRADLFTTAVTDQSNVFAAGTWTSNPKRAQQKNKTTQIATVSEWTKAALATALINANALSEDTEPEVLAKKTAVLEAKNAILTALQPTYFKYGYANTDIIAFDEVNTLSVTLGAFQYAYAYNTDNSKANSGTGSVCEANVVIYTTDLKGDVKSHTYTMDEAKMSATRTINFETANFIPEVDEGRYIVGIQFYPFSGWTDPDKLNLSYTANGTNNSSGKEMGYVKWDASTYYSIDTPVPSLNVASTIDGKIEGLEKDKSYEITSLVIEASGKALQQVEWVEYDENASLAGLYQLREVDDEGNAVSKDSNIIYIYGKQADRAKLFETAETYSTQTTDFVVGKWTSASGMAKKSDTELIQSRAWLASSTNLAKDLRAALAMSETTEKEIAEKEVAVSAAKQAIFDKLNDLSIKYACTNTAVIAVDEINTLKLYATTGSLYGIGYNTTNTGSTVGTYSVCSANIVFYVTDLEGKVTPHTYITDEVAISAVREINFETGTFNPALPQDGYVVAIEVFPYSGWTDTSKTVYARADTSQLGGGVKWTASYYSIDTVCTTPLNITSTPDGKIEGLEADKKYQITSLVINTAGDGLQQVGWAEYDENASLAGLYQMREVDAEGTPVTLDSNIIYVYGSPSKRADLFTTLARKDEKTTNFYPGEWTSSKRAQYNNGVICTVLSALDGTYATDLKDKIESGNEDDILAQKNIILNALRPQSFRYGYDTTDIIAFDEVNELSVVLGAHQYAYAYNVADSSVANSGTGSICKADVVIYTTDLKGNVKSHTYTTDEAKMSATRTINFETANFIPEVDEGRYIVGIEFFPFAHWTDPNELEFSYTAKGNLNSNGCEMGKVSWKAATYYSIDKVPSAKPEISIDDTYGILEITNYNAEYNYFYSADGGESWTKMTGSQASVTKASTEYIVKARESEFYLESEASEPAFSPAVVLVGASLILDGKIGIKAYFDIDTKRISELDFEITKINSDYENDPTNPLYQEVCNAYIGSTSTWNSGVVYDEEKELYYLIAFVPAKDIDNVSFACDIGAYENDAPTVRVFYHDMFERFGFNEYIEDVKTFAEMGYTEFISALDLVEAMEVYCAGADVFFDDNKTLTEEIALTEDEINALEDIKATLKLSNIITNKTIGNLEYYASTLILGESVTIRHYFKVKGEVNALDYTITGATPLTVENESLVYVDVVDVPAQRLSENIQVTVTYGDESTTITYSALHYVSGYYATSNDELSELRNLAKAIYRYSVEADKYEETVGKFVPVMRFVVTGDVHLRTGTTTYLSQDRLASIFSTAYGYADSHESYNGLDGIFFTGDNSQAGTEAEQKAFFEYVEENTREGTVSRAVMGNHEFHTLGYDAVEEVTSLFLQCSGYESEDAHIVIGGYHFIFLSMDNYVKAQNLYFGDEKLEWLKAQLDEAVADDPTKQIFVFQHEPPYATQFNTTNTAADKNLKTLLDNYPQVVNFAGHTHNNLADPRNVWQGTFTALNTGSMAYLSRTIPGTTYGEGGVHEVDKEGAWTATYKDTAHSETTSRDGGMYYIVEIDANGVIQILIYNIFTESIYGEPITISSVNPDNFTYTNDRVNLAIKPEFEPDAEITALSKNYKNMLVQFPQATCKDIVQAYRVEVYKEDLLISSVYRLSGSNYGDAAPETIKAYFSGLDPATEYIVKVYAISSYALESEPLVLSIATDVDSDTPLADILDVTFNSDGTVVNAPTGEVLDAFGAPTVIYDEALGMNVGSFDGVDDAVAYNGIHNWYEDIGNSYTIEAYVQIPDSVSVATNVLSNMENGGFGLQYRTDGKLYYMTYIDGAYVTTSAGVTAGEWIHVVGVYDGSYVKMYLDGELKEEIAVSGQFSSPNRYMAYFLAIGGDPSAQGSITNLFKGDIAIARIYSEALSTEQIAEIYADIIQ